MSVYCGVYLTDSEEPRGRNHVIKYVFFFAKFCKYI